MQLQVETQIYKKNGVGKDINAAQTTANNALSNSQAKYAISSTGASQTIKIAYFEPAFNDWELFNGAEIFVKFTNKATNIDVEEVDRDQLPVLSLILFPSETIVDNYINATVEEKAEYETKYKVLSIIDSDGNALSPICYWETPNSVVHLMCDGTHWRILDIVSGKKYNDMIITIDEFSNTIGDQITHINADLSAETSARESSFRQTATSIESVVANNTTYTAPDGTIKTNTIQSAIKQNADDILLRVEKDGVIAAINASVEEEGGSAVKISADKVNITGTTIFNSQDFQELANAAYDAHGAAAAVAATIPDTSNLATKGEAVYRTQRIYQRRTAATNLSTNETWLTTSGTGYENWSLQIPPLTHVENNVEVKYLYLYTAVQTQTVTQYNSGALTNNCSCSPVLLDETTTVIDGGSIITHSIDANKISVQNLSAISAKLGLIKAGKIQNGDAGTNFIDFGDGTAGSQATLEFKNDTTWVNATQGIKYDSGQLLIKGHINATSLTIGEGDTSYDAIDAINVGGYTIEINENSSNNDITDFNSQTYIYPILYHNGIAVPEYSLSEDLEITDNSKTYYTRSGNEGNYIYTVVTNPTGNPHTNNYYERFDYTNFIWFRDGISFQTGSSIDGGIVASYGHTYRVTYEFADGAAGEGGSPVQTVTVIDTRYITEINKAGIKIHPETGNNINYIQLDGTGMEVVSEGISRAKYGVTSRIGKAYIDGADDNESHLELDYHSLRMVDREGVPYFWVSDLRDVNNKVSVSETFTILEDAENLGSPDINTYYLLRGAITSINDIIEVKINGITISNWEASEQPTGMCIHFTSDEGISIGDTATVIFYDSDNNFKAFTFGTRQYPDYITTPGPYSIAMGKDVIADGYHSFATGYATQAYGDTSHSEGLNTIARGFASHAEGEETEARGNCSHASGLSTIAAADYQTVVGKYNQEDEDATFIIGNGTDNINRSNLMVVGDNLIRIGNLGDSYLELDYHSLQLIDREGDAYFYISDLRDKTGICRITTEEISQGYENLYNLYGETTNTSTVEVKVIDTNGVEVTADYEVTTSAIRFTSSLPKGYHVKATYDTNSDRAKVLTFGSRRLNSAIGMRSVALGSDISSSGYCSYAEGASTISTGYIAHAEGSSTQAIGSYSHAEGGYTIASAPCTHAEGSHTEASETGAHAEGMNTIASGINSHAEGRLTVAQSMSAHAEGSSSVASGTSAHAEGSGTLAKGANSHAEGYECQAKSFASHAQNMMTIATEENQTVIGKYNTATRTGSGTTSDPYVYTNAGNYAFIIGNGTGDVTTNRSNALTVAWNGNTTIAGTLTQSSDRRLKEHISYLNTDAINFIQKLKPAHFKKDNQPHLGFYAQDVESVDPWHCMTGEMNGFKTLGYTEIIAPLVAYCQHLEERIKQLEEK